MDLANVFKGINKKMLDDFDYISKQVEHKPSKGEIREIEIANEYLKKYIPFNIGVSTGEIVSIDNQVSSETDIVLYEKNSTPYLMSSESYQVFPIECVYGVIEVKSFLDKAQLYDSFQKINSVKKMPKDAYIKPIPPIHSLHAYGKTWSEYFPTYGCLIAFNSIDLRTLKKHLETLQEGIPYEQRIDSIYILSKGMIVNLNNSGSVDPFPSSQSRLGIFESDNPLLPFTIHLQSLCLSAWTPIFDIKQYVKDDSIGVFIG